MRTRTLGATASLLAAAGFLPSFQPQPAPVPGPGAVIEAVRGIFAAAQKGDRAYLQKAFVSPELQDGVAVVVGPDGDMEMEQGGGVLLQDIGKDGKVVQAKTPADSIQAMLESVGGKGVENRITAAIADCPDGRCSWASVEFDRTVRNGDDAKVVPMRVTVLARYADTAPHMRVMIWHASPR
jgi:hypothetical protein